MSSVNKKTPRQRMIERVQATQIIKRVNDCALGKISMTNEELRAAQMCINKVLPDLKSVEMKHDGAVGINVIENVIVYPER